MGVRRERCGQRPAWENENLASGFPGSKARGLIEAAPVLTAKRLAAHQLLIAAQAHVRHGRFGLWRRGLAPRKRGGLL